MPDIITLYSTACNPANLGAIIGISAALLIILMIIDVILRGFALYYSAREEKKPWFFISLLVLNTLGIWPAIYLFYIRRKRKR